MGSMGSMGLAVKIAVWVTAWLAQAEAASPSRHLFFREMDERLATSGAELTRSGRRVFGGTSAELSAWPPACALLDRYWHERCSASVVAPRWALTAAHCISPHIAYVKYNARRPTSAEGDMSLVLYLYKHPEYEVVQEDVGRGDDITLLHHDVGLVRTRDDMTLGSPLSVDPLVALRRHSPEELKGKHVEVVGFGRTERSEMGDELFAVQLRVVPCGRERWKHCICGVSPGASGTSGVCSGDSGGPVVYRGAQVAVTSMGPVECMASVHPPPFATGVFTTMYHYVDLINATIADMDDQLAMREISSSCLHRPSSVFTAGILLCFSSSFH